MDTFDRIVELLAEKKVSGAKMSRDLGFSTAVFSQWKHRLQKPSADKVSKMAEYFDVSVGYILGTEGIEQSLAAKTGEDIEDIDVAFFGDYQKLSENDKNTLRDMAALMRQRKVLQPKYKK